MENYKVFLNKERELIHRLRKAKIFKKDIQETFVLSSGPGGQNINKVASCVSLYHSPTGIRIKSQKERSQKANRHVAYELLLKKVTQLQEKEMLAQQQELHKKKKGKSTLRPARIQEEVLKHKHIQSEKKNLRKKINYNAVNEEM